MKKMTVKMPEVAMCGVSECAYNNGELCCAHAITVGDMDNPQCDTYLNSDTHVKASNPIPAGVGACKVSACYHNKEFSCMADSIEVDHGSDPADCMTFKKR